MATQQRKSSSRMLLGRDRLFYSGLVGYAMRTRRLGAVAIYAAPDMSVRVGDGPWRDRTQVALKPHTPHILRARSGRIANLCLEPESIDRDELTSLIAALNARDDAGLMDRLQEARREGAPFGDVDGFSTRAFDKYFFGRALKRRDLDPRVQVILDLLIDARPEQMISADICARRVGVSTSRFLHLFKDNTDISFRLARMWKRARRFMDHANRDDSLTDVALELGYPDSSHFSHSIRACFGLQPRSIRLGSRGMKVFTGENYALSCAL